jgi:hypothetical protein
MSLIRRLRITINADAIAKGVLEMMRERHALTGDAEDDETLVRFGMLPKRWMDILESQMTSVICERFKVSNYEKRTGEVMTMLDDGAFTFKLRELVNEMVHEVSLAMYGNVDMVV